MNSCKKISISLLRHPPSVKGRQVTSPRKKLQNFKSSLVKFTRAPLGEEFPFDHTLGQTNSSLSVSSQRFHFSAKMDEHPELAGKAFRDEFLEISKRLPPKAQALTKSLLKASKSTRKTLFFFKKSKFSPGRRAAAGFIPRNKS